MPELIDPQLLDRDLEAARREFAAMERDEGRTDKRVAVAQKAGKFRGPLALFLGVYPLIREADDAWRRSVFQARQPFDANTDEAVRKLYAVWLGYSRMFVEEAEYLGRRGADFEDDLVRLGKYVREAANLLRSWEPPTPSLGPSFRTPPLSAETTARLRAMFPDKV
jgi:hypothetical protein